MRLSVSDVPLDLASHRTILERIPMFRSARYAEIT